MLISRVPDDESREAEYVREPHDHSQEYQTANELFDLISKNHAFSSNDSPLSTSDLVILYKNIDIGTRLLSATKPTNKSKRPNQHVETVVYNDEADSDSDLGEIYSDEDLQDVFQINKERIDLLNTPLSLENTLCHKLGDLKLQTPDLTTDYGKHFLFKDPYIKEQLEYIKIMSNSKELHNTVLPSSLLDYICCKRLEDNYNFYMENAIIYVKHTIEQLQRISNGDYLTEKAKQKWREREAERCPEKFNTDEKTLATTTSIPLQLERKVQPCLNPTWDDLVHSEVDIRSLSKILEKKIFLEIPKIICGSYRLFSKCSADNFVISCKRTSPFEAKDEKQRKSTVDVVFKLNRFDSGHFMSNINSIMILQTSPHSLQEASLPDILPLASLKTEGIVNKNEGNVRIVELDNGIDELDDHKYDNTEECSTKENLCIVLDTASNSDSNFATNDSTYSEFENTSSVYSNTSYHALGQSSCNFKNMFNTKATGALCRDNTTFNHIITPDELRLTMRKLDIQTSLPEESSEDLQHRDDKKKSPTRVRIKSPYENKSYVIEEKKRKKLIEIRERREKKKMALNESCRIIKHKYGGKGAMTPQPSSSVTKLSISNKSFYNSIYGQNDVKQQKTKKNNKVSILNGDRYFGEEVNDSFGTPDRDSKRYINRSFYLDDTVTEITRMQMKKEKMGKELCSTSTSAVSTDLGPNFSILSQLISNTNLECKDNSLVIRCDTDDELDRTSPNVHNNEPFSKVHFQSENNVVPENAPKSTEPCESDFKNVTLECRKSIEKIYDIMKKFVQIDTAKENPPKINAISTFRESSTAHTSDSGTSLKHHRTLSDDSGFSFQKANNSKSSTAKHINEMTAVATTVIPKVTINSKSQIQRTDVEKHKKDKKKVIFSTPKTVPDNPLKAISHLLHEFDNVQKTRQKGSDVKSNKKAEPVLPDGRNSCRQRSFVRKSKIDQQGTNCEQILPKNVTIAAIRDKKPTTSTDIAKIPHQHIPLYEKSNDKSAKKKISDIIDEAKEARGEAVRGPTKTSRLNTLAQPKRSYVQAHSEEFQNKYGRNLMTDRLQRLAATQPRLILDKSITFSNWRKLRRGDPEVTSSVSVKQPPRSTSPLEKWKQRSSTSSSPDGNKQPPAELSYKVNHVDAPEILKNKMVDVESYVKLHYGRVSPKGAAAPSFDPRAVTKSRIPLVPTDLELSSVTSSPTAEESTMLGSKLHNLIDTMLSWNSTELDAVSECPETNSKLNNADDSIGEEISKGEEAASIEPVVNIDMFKDTNINTAIVGGGEKKLSSSEINIENARIKYDVKPFNSVTEMDRLKKSLQYKISLGSLQTQMRIKKLTLTPKQSMQQVVLLQSGDASPLILKATLSQNLKVNVGSCKEHMSDFNDSSLLTNTLLDWNFAKIPMQITTVGYTFPSYQNVQESVGECTNFGAKSTRKEENLLTNFKSDKTCQCFKRQEINMNVKEIDQVEACKSSNVLNKTNKIPVLLTKEKIIDKVKNGDNKNEHLSASNNETCTNENVNTTERTINENLDDIEYTNSLDMLVALLNEIQKITTCQTLPKSNSDEVHHKQLETMLNNAAPLETVTNDPRELISITSLDKLRQLDSNPSIYSLYISNGRKRETKEIETCMTPISTAEKIHDKKPISADKEISVNIPDKLYTNIFSKVPSHLIPVTVNHSTNITSSLIEVLSKPTTQSVTSYTDYNKVHYNASFNSQKLLDLCVVENAKLNNSLNSFEIDDHFSNDNEKSNTVSQLELVIANIEPTPKEICIPKLTKSISKLKYYFAGAIVDRMEIYDKHSNNKSDTVSLSKVIDNIETEPKEIIIPKLMKSESNSKFYVALADTDKKIKRDILVTLYSVLVFTIFAALSFPDLVYHA